MDVRHGEESRSWFRSSRFVCVNGQYFYQTREGSTEGPFDSAKEAEMDLLLYLRHAEDCVFQGVA
ncbi:DUF6316 family protein [Marinobacter mobilis]|uniref:DUF6316 domain-containing protein n=1 Tax=Marinobacter mobilis TaxID=488533 RepID=A0A1H2XKL1_9GAMM|nr:DUF6316 family protein [Marinobacter mobilis]SDW93441.1 hypothetical protein SAMN04487960_10586 [Marinobacter mobilis]